MIRTIIRMVFGWRFCLAVNLTFWTFVSAGQAKVVAIHEIHLTQIEQEAALHVLDARLALARWNLEQLVLLRKEGHASWLEVARKQAAIDTLAAQRIAKRKTAKLVRALGERAGQLRNSTGTGTSAGTSRELPVIKLFLPGSLRLVGWLGAEQVCAKTRSLYLTTLHEVSPKPGEWQRHVGLAEESAAERENKIQELAKIRGSERATRELQHAKLEFTLAKAQLELSHIMKQAQQKKRRRIERLLRVHNRSSVEGDGVETTDRNHSTLISASPLTDSNTSYVTSDSDLALWLATLRVAAAEASRTGEVRVANLTLQRMRLRLQALEQLQDNGFATKSEVVKARKQLHAAEYTRQRLLEQSTRLNESYVLLRRASELKDIEHDHNGQPVSSANLSGNSLNGNWNLKSLPDSCFVSATVVRHLIELVRMADETEAASCALRAERKLLQDREEKLRKTHEFMSEKQEQSDKAQAQNDLRDLLRARRHREQETLHLEIQLTAAQLLAAKERLDIIRLEWQRFAHQLRHQLNDGSAPSRQDVWFTSLDNDRQRAAAAAWSLVTLAINAIDPIGDQAFKVDLPGDRYRRVGYVESLRTLQLASIRQPTKSTLNYMKSEIAYHPTGQRRRSQIGYTTLPQRLSRIGSCPTSHRIGNLLWPVPYGCERMNWLNSRYRLYFPDHSVFCRRSTTLAHVPNYSEYYAFGIRRTDFRAPPSRHGRVTSFGGPWYMPGAPTNFRP